MIKWWLDEKPLPRGAFSLPGEHACPDCGTHNLIGITLVHAEGGQHAHTHYLCRVWECGWHGWSVP